MLPKVEPHRTGKMTVIERRGESGTRRQASPDPRTTHVPDRKVRVVCW
jgi:hypothetical protein